MTHWAEDDDKKLVIALKNGLIKTVWNSYYVRGKPADPPVQEYEHVRKVLSETNDMPFGWGDVLLNKELFLEEENGRFVAKIYKKAQVVLIPPNVFVNEPVNITAKAENGDNKEAILYIDGEEQARASMPATWSVIFETPGIYRIEVDAGRHGKVEKQVVVE